ncbi:hypothetical protein JHK87_009167 [Glycine soja]|nr:hypothetical protein JHK87_009167 [Glycine soja]
MNYFFFFIVKHMTPLSIRSYHPSFKQFSFPSLRPEKEASSSLDEIWSVYKTFSFSFRRFCALSSFTRCSATKSWHVISNCNTIKRIILMPE